MSTMVHLTSLLLFFISLVTAGPFKFLGVNEAGAEFAATVPGIPERDFAFPNLTAIDILLSKGMNTFRIPFVMERMAPDGLSGSLSEAYLANLTDVVNHVTAARNNTYAVLDAHNYGRYRNEIITSTTDFQAYWQKLAKPFANNPRAIFDCNNEYHDMGDDDTLTPRLNQACINGVRAAGATSQFIFVQGTAYTGAWTWTRSGNAATMGILTDPTNRPNSTSLIVYEMHQYLDEDASGTNEECVNSTIGAERIQDGANWLRQNQKRGIIGEFAGGNNDVCKQAVMGMLENMANTDVWLGALWWAAGPFWGDYIFSMEPGSGIAFDNYLDRIVQFA